MYLSVVIPVFNEEENIKPMYEAVESALNSVSYEIVFVDDGSNDSTVEKILALNKPNIKLVCFSRNFGQTSAMAAGILEASGEFIATLDGDLQNDPSDILMMVEKLKKENLDLVAGRRLKRKDGFIFRKIPSLCANYLIRKITGIKIKDLGCSLKVFRESLAKNLDLYGELHRFIPILAHMQGAKIGEVDVKHHARIYGKSKYGINRTLKVVSDLLLMYFFQKYKQKPMHLFGTIGVSMFLIGSIIEGYLLLLKAFGESIGTRPLFYIGILLIITSVQLITTGFLAELIMRTYFGAQNKKPYSIKKVYHGNMEIKSE